jgi:adenylate kinase family enzyme
MPLIEYYQARGLLVEIDGQRDVESVNSDMVVVLEKVKSTGGVSGSLVA